MSEATSQQLVPNEVITSPDGYNSYLYQQCWMASKTLVVILSFLLELMLKAVISVLKKISEILTLLALSKLHTMCTEMLRIIFSYSFIIVSHFKINS